MYEWFKACLSSSLNFDDHQINFICVGLNVIWRCRNLGVMEGKNIDPVKAISMIYAMWSSYKSYFSIQNVCEKYLIPASDKNHLWKSVQSLPTSGVNVICLTRKRRNANGKTTTVHVFIIQNNQLFLHGAYGLKHQQDLQVAFLSVLRRGIQLSIPLAASTKLCNIIVFQKGWASMITSNYKKYSGLQVLGTDVHKLLGYFLAVNGFFLSSSVVLNSFIRNYCNISYKVPRTSMVPIIELDVYSRLEESDHQERSLMIPFLENSLCRLEAAYNQLQNVVTMPKTAPDPVELVGRGIMIRRTIWFNNSSKTP
ncbi:uncharacterized protein G2W53_001421 [Senna tora]|uniref:Uncharacterized protein n=1 Tax=Senna tora TaxID=362788 RepID=A0A835CKB1_9FABA|nr:uncharacterized protein G2W53_001421 [Senna tora]